MSACQRLFPCLYINKNLEDHSGKFEVTLPDSDQMDDILDFLDQRPGGIQQDHIEKQIQIESQSETQKER